MTSDAASPTPDPGGHEVTERQRLHALPLPGRAGMGAQSPKLFDANALLGPLPRQPQGAPADVPALLAVMDEYGIDRALVTHTYAKWHHPGEGNARLQRELAD